MVFDRPLALATSPQRRNFLSVLYVCDAASLHTPGIMYCGNVSIAASFHTCLVLYGSVLCVCCRCRCERSAVLWISLN